MSYIGNKPATSFETVQKQISTSNSGTTITLDRAVTSVQDILLTIDAVVQSYDNYSVSGTTLTVGGTLSNNRVEILYVGRTMQSVDPTDDSVSASKIKTDAVTTAKVQNDAITVDKLNLISTSSVPSLEAKGDGSSVAGKIKLNCHVNSHGVTLQSPDHSSSQSWTLKLPDNSPTADKFLKVKSITGSGSTATGQLEFADAGGTLVEVAQSSIAAGSSVAAVEFSNIFTSTYNTYFVRIGKIRFAGNTSLQMRTYSDTGTTENSGSFHNYVRYGLNNSGAREDGNGDGQNRFYLTESLDYNQPADGGASGHFYINNPLANDSFSFTMHGQFSYRDDSDYWNGINFSGKYSGSSARYGFKLYGSSNVEYADITVYGVKP